MRARQSLSKRIRAKYASETAKGELKAADIGSPTLLSKARRKGLDHAGRRSWSLPNHSGRRGRYARHDAVLHSATKKRPRGLGEAVLANAFGSLEMSRFCPRYLSWIQISTGSGASYCGTVNVSWNQAPRFSVAVSSVVNKDKADGKLGLKAKK